MFENKKKQKISFFIIEREREKKLNDALCTFLSHLHKNEHKIERNCVEQQFMSVLISFCYPHPHSFLTLFVSLAICNNTRLLFTVNFRLIQVNEHVQKQ